MKNLEEVSRQKSKRNERIYSPTASGKCLPKVRSPSVRIPRRIIFPTKYKILPLPNRPTLLTLLPSRAKRHRVRGELTLYYPNRCTHATYGQLDITINLIISDILTPGAKCPLSVV
ncbi:hypothetical protein CEXT_698241 [Caerostris extrusa]|uniref:Ribosomal protein S12 n=1 Tax=Caerostris extrusa TaxID=172846 RepID=A0AAV4QDI8_CAEEX|nr:hypothetical protein CEXT_698241 [Caerostris extrusa]